MASETCFLRLFFFIRPCWSSEQILERRAYSPSTRESRHGYSSIQPFLPYVFFHTLRHEFPDGAFGAHRVADFGGGDFLVYVIQQAQGNSGQDKISFRWLPGERFGGFGPGAQLLRQRGRNVGE